MRRAGNGCMLAQNSAEHCLAYRNSPCTIYPAGRHQKAPLITFKRHRRRHPLRPEQHIWSSAAIVCFSALCIAAVFVLEHFRSLPAELEFIDLALLGLATLRVIHLLTYDKMFGPIRESFMDGSGPTLRKAARGWRRLVCELLECLWCTGMWSSVLVLTAYLVSPISRFFVIVLAVAGLGSLLQVLSKGIAARIK